MSIEPINSVMSIQQQTYSPAPKPANTSADSAELRASVDAAAPALEDIAIVDNATQKGNADNSQNSDSNQDNAQVSKEQMKKAVEKINSAQMENSEAVFGFHEETNRVTIKIVDKKTKEVIKELPPEKTLDMIAKVWEMAGLFVNEKR
ncbi:MAG: flagellar protein FlaG [Lachnospiraceae bacterium]|nr:flagellar protein FlaG [Lachnospiraceae bacterium]